MKGDRLGYVVQQVHSGLNFFELDPITHMLDLIVFPPMDVELPIAGVHADKIASLVHHLRKVSIVGILNKAFRRSQRIIVVAFAHVGSQQEKLPSLAIGNPFSMVIKNQEGKVAGDPSQRWQPVQIAKVVTGDLVTGADARALRWSIDIEELTGV